MIMNGHLSYIHYMDVSKNRGIWAPKKWMVKKINVPNPISKWMIWGVFTIIFGNAHIAFEVSWLCITSSALKRPRDGRGA